MKSITDQIEQIMCENEGKVFSINDFYYLGTKNTVKSALHRLKSEEKIARLIDGLYAKPQYSEVIREKSYPYVTEVAEKIADKFAWKIIPTDDAALNFTGLCNQVPNNYIYASSGPCREYLYRGRKIVFRHTSNRKIIPYSRKLSIIIQAIEYLGQNMIEEIDLKRLASFSRDIREELKRDTFRLPFWIQEILWKVWELSSEENIRIIT